MKHRMEDEHKIKPFKPKDISKEQIDSVAKYVANNSKLIASILPDGSLEVLLPTADRNLSYAGKILIEHALKDQHATIRECSNHIPLKPDSQDVKKPVYEDYTLTRFKITGVNLGADAVLDRINKGAEEISNSATMAGELADAENQRNTAAYEQALFEHNNEYAIALQTEKMVEAIAAQKSVIPLVNIVTKALPQNKLTAQEIAAFREQLIDALASHAIEIGKSTGKGGWSKRF